MTTETLDKLYLEWSNFTKAKTAKELALEAEITRLQERDREARERLAEIGVYNGKEYIPLLFTAGSQDEWLDWRDAFLEKADG